MQQLIPILWGFLGPLLTALVEKATNAGGHVMPGPVKVAVNYAGGMGLATMMANPTDPNAVQFAAIGGALGAMIGNRLREAMKKVPTPPKP